jgi:hypothetical protein
MISVYGRRLAGLSDYWRCKAIQLEHECGGRETTLSALMRFRAAVLLLAAACFGYRA